MSASNRYVLMTTAAALCSLPLLAFGQANTGGSSTMPQTTQTTPQTSPMGSAPGAQTQAPIPGPTTAQTAPATRNTPDGTAGNPPSTATQRAVDAVTGTRTDPDGTGNNPPGTAAGRAIDRATDGVRTTTTTPSGTMAPATTGATTPGMSVDSARMTGGLRVSRVIGANIYNENNDRIGEVEDLIIPTAGGQPVAIVQVGGFLGIGGRLVAVPYERLQRNAERDRWTLPGATRESLQGLPAYTYEDGARRG